MKARELIRNASYGPEHLKALFTAFDQAWESMAGDVGTNPLAVEAARLKLAGIILSLGNEFEGSRLAQERSLADHASRQSRQELVGAEPPRRDHAPCAVA